MTGIEGALARLLARPIAHRGLHGCGRGDPVENTVAAAQAAITADYGIECDVRLSRDGQVVVFHDDDLSRLAGVAGRCCDLDAAEIAALRLSENSAIPTLAAFLAAVAGRAPLVIELKADPADPHGLADAVMRDLAGYGGPVALESFDAATLRRLRDAPMPIGLIGPDDRAAPAALPRCDFLSWNIEHLAEAETHLALTTWTVRTPAQLSTARRFGAQIVFEGLAPA